MSKEGKEHKHGSEIFMGVCRLKEDTPHRRIDIRSCHRNHYAFGLSNFTGSKQFLRGLNLFAKRKGFALAKFGLSKTIRAEGERVWSGESIICDTEEQVFKALHLDYKTPLERDL